MSSEISSRTNICRACMTEGGKMLPIYDEEITNKINLPYKLAELTSVQIDKYDGLPNMLCSKCAYRTDVFYNFKLKVQESDKILRMQLQNQMDIKNELNEYDKEDNIEQINESFELNVLDDKIPIHNADCLKDPEILSETVKDEQQVQSNEYNNNKENNLQLETILCNFMQEVNEDQTNVQFMKTEIPEEISRMLDSQDVTIMYIPNSMIESITKSNEENTLDVPDEEQENLENSNEIFFPEVEVIDEQNNEDILSNASIFRFVTERKRRNKRAYQNDNRMQNEYKKITFIENDSNVKQSTRPKDSNESDSDYFIDAQDNILGSLNDTITRIKEVKQENRIKYQCTLCLHNYDQLIDVLLHTIDNHIPSSGPFFCIACEKDCESHRELRTHAKTHVGQFPYVCFICKKAYSSKRYLKRHMVCHPDFQRHRCPKCGCRFKVKSELESHEMTHLHGTPFACSQCPRQFNHKGNYKRHLISHLDPQGLHLPKYPCRYCGKRFSNNRTLETHMRVHTGEKPFKCEICNKLFSQQGNLLNHMKIHRNPRSYKCDVCGKSFNQRATLRDHGLLHTGEKPYVCNECGKAFTFSAALRRHMFSHKPDGKPLRCETCGMGFVGKYDLRRHMRVHTDRPKERQKRNTTSKSNNSLRVETKEECFTVVEEPKLSTETVLIEQVLLPQDVTDVTVHQVESEKENEDELFNLQSYNSILYSTSEKCA